MKCLSVGLCLLVVAETAVLSGMNHFTDGHEVEENLVLSRRKEFTEHDHRTDSAYAGILGNEDELDALHNLDPSAIKLHMLNVIEKMDSNKNGFIEKNELVEKLLEIYSKLSSEESDSEFKISDLDENGFITWKEYVGDIYGSSEDLYAFNEEKEIFLAADINKDGQLDEIEFRYFYTPEDYLHMQTVVARGIMNKFDTDKNGQISFQEFIEDRKKMEYDNEWIQENNIKFTQELDINKNGVLDLEEVYNLAAPNNKILAENEANSLISKADNNNDGKLTSGEILEKYSLFISPESDGYYIFKDEL